MKHRIKDKTVVFDNGTLQIQDVALEIETYAGGVMPLNRIAMIRPEVVCLLLENTDTHSLILVEQFRYSALKCSNGWVVEVVAGVLEAGEEPQACAIREGVEESGYRAQEVQKVFAYMPSLGVSDQLIHLFFARVTSADRIEKGGGLQHETEDIRVIELPIKTALDQLHAGEFIDAKTIIALQWFAANRHNT